MIPLGAELAVAQHLEDLLCSDRGQELLGRMTLEWVRVAVAYKKQNDETAYVRALRELAAWLASQLVREARSELVAGDEPPPDDGLDPWDPP